MRAASFALAVALVFVLPGCGEEQENGTKTITLSRGATLSLATSTDGTTVITATVPPGTDGAGTYTSSAGSLVDTAREAKNSLNEKGVTVEITVDAKGRLLAVSHTRTK
jgi:hypothetical protein